MRSCHHCSSLDVTAQDGEWGGGGGGHLVTSSGEEAWGGGPSPMEGGGYMGQATRETLPNHLL